MGILRRFRLLPFALLSGLGLPSLAHGQWTSNGIPVCTFSGVQFSPKVVPDGTGGCVVFWVDGRDLRRDLYTQRLTADGQIAVGWPISGVFLGGVVSELGTPVGIPDGTGGAIVVWEDDEAFSVTHYDLYAQRIRGNGTIAPGWPAEGVQVCTALKDQRAPRVISDEQGGAHISWFDLRNDPTENYLNPDIYAQHITADGKIAPGWPVDGIAICTTPDGQWEPTLAPDGSGGAIISWYDDRNLATTGGDIFAQRITASGDIGWTPNGVPVSTAPGHQTLPETVADGAGGAILIWLDRRTDPDRDVYAQRITGDGSIALGWPPDGVPLSTGPGYQFFLDAAADGMGGAIVTWYDNRNYSVSASDILAQRVTGEGAIPPGWPSNGLPVCMAPGFQLNPKLAPDGTGGAYFVWEDTRSGGNEDVYALHVTASGSVAPGWQSNGIAISTEPTSQPKPAIAPDGLGGAIMAWADFRNGNSDIFAHKLGIDGPVPTLLSLVDIEAGAAGVLLTWSGPGAGSLTATVQRRTQPSEWEALGAPMSEGPDLLRYEDRSIVPGTRYAYRLAYRDEGTDRFTEETWVDVPALALSLAGFRPNPAMGTATVAFSLPDARPARLDVIDVKGRVVHSRDVGSLGGGSHILPLAGETALPPGMYWIRLTHPERTVTTKGLVVR